MTRTNATTATIAVAADYADAMMTARRAKNWLFILLLLVLLTQLTIFFLLRFKVLRLDGDVSVTVPTGVDAAATQPEGATQPSDAASQPVAASARVETATKSFGVPDILRYVIPVTDFLGITLLVVLTVVLLLIVMIMLVGRLIGVSHVTSAFIWCVLLAVMVFPWQAFLRDSAFTSREWVFPGALYTWEELRRDYSFENLSAAQSVLKWARFAGFPILALLLLLMVQAKSSRGLKFALGESEVQVEVTGGDRLT